MKLLKAVALITVGIIWSGCSGDDGTAGADGPPGAKGDKGDKGEPGPKGEQGEKGEQGDPGASGIGAAGAGGDSGVSLPMGTLNATCMKPCHTFAGIVEQWKTSRHYATYVANLGGEEVESWTGAKACGNCHAADGPLRREAGTVNYPGSDTGPADIKHGQLNYKDSANAIKEVIYSGSATVAIVGCGTCHDNSPEHDPHIKGVDYVKGAFPLRFPVGPDDYAVTERSSAVGESTSSQSAKKGPGNACIWCHKSRKDVTNYVLDVPNNNISSSTWGPHEGPQADVYVGAGKGVYEFAGKTYGNFGPHASLAKGCVSCHMPPIEEGGIGNHSFYPQLSGCNISGCHGSAPLTDFNHNSLQTNIKATLQALREKLNGLLLLSRDGTIPLSSSELTDDNYALDKALTAKAATDLGGRPPVTGPVAGALYNYFVMSRGSGFGVHNPTYVKQVLYDSITQLGGTSPMPRP